MAGLAVYWNWLHITALWLTGFKGLLRLQDLLEIRRADFTHNAATRKILLSIPDSKAGRKSVTWSIKGQDCFSSLVLVLKEDQMPGDFLFNLSAAHLRSSMRQPPMTLCLNHLLITPLSLRKGKAPHLIRDKASLGEIAEFEYWRHLKTCRPYIDSALIDLSEEADQATGLLRHAQGQPIALF